MKKILVILMTFICLFSFVGCDEKEPEPTVDDYANHKKVIALVNNYSVVETNGFDYSLEQKLGERVTNAHTISIRLDNTGDTIGSRVEYQKSLNEDISKVQYTETSVTAYYKGNKIATYVDDAWTWKTCTLEEFVTINIGSFAFDFDSLTNLKLSASGKYSFLTFKIDDDNASSFLGINGDIKNLSFEIKTDDAYTKIVSFTMSYSQNLTSTRFSFTPYSGSINIDIPE